MHTKATSSASALRWFIFPLACCGTAAWSQTVVTVGNVQQLRSAVAAANAAGGNQVIQLQDGVYTLPDTLYVNAPNVSLVGASSDRTKVTIQGDAMSATATVGTVIRVTGKGFRLSHLTVARSRNHLIQIVGENDADDAQITNCILRDAYEQMLKVSIDVSRPATTADSGRVENCLFEYSATTGPQYYIGGFDAHGSKNWVIRGNTFRNIKSPSREVAEFAIHFWTNSQDNLVERNLILDCDRGIGFGLGDRGNQRGVIRNNMIYSSANAGPFADTGIALENSPGTQVYNNTVILQNGYPSAIEYRFPATTGVKLYNNLTNVAIRARDGAQGELVTNLGITNLSSFVDVASGNLHLVAASPAVNVGTPVASVTDDFDGQPRPQGSAPDIGADEYSSSVPRAPTDLRVF